MIALNTILVPHDFSDTSEEALQYALDLARLTGATLHLLHVSEKVHGEMGVEFPLGLDGSPDDAVRVRLLKIMEPAAQRGVQLRCEVRSGSAWPEIVRYAGEQGIDLIVMGTHGRGFIGHAVLGSVAEDVVRHAPCPVLTVRAPRAQPPMATERRERTVTIV
jgi:nucleotide-binding universal stress UspA family protein